MNERLTRLFSEFDKLSVDAIVVTSYENIRYLSGFTSGDAMLFIHPEKQVLITDSRYTEQAEKQSGGYAIITTSQFLSMMGHVKAACEELGVKRIGFESEQTSVSWLKKAQEGVPGVEFIPLTDELSNLRAVKDQGEIDRIAAAQKIADAAFTRILDFIKPGITEIDISSELCYYMAQCGCKESFDTICASGPNSSMPHAQPTARKIQNGDFVTMDFGCKYDGYCSDMTRTICVGAPDDEMKRIYSIVLEAQLRSLEAIRPGVVCSEVDAAGRGYITEQGFGACFGHGLGHSFGLYIHEEPRFSPTCSAILREGMCLSVEPGIYLSGRFGVRIEDIILAKGNGYHNFTGSPKELIIL